jgi:hypothetical protein
VRRARFDRTKFDGVFLQFLLKFVGEKFASAVGLNPLNREGHFFDHLFQKDQRIGGCSANKKGLAADSSAIINSSILIKTRSDFTSIHLDTLARNRTLVLMTVFSQDAALLAR